MEVTTKIIGEIAIVTISNPPVNAINYKVRKGLWDARNQTDADDQIKAVLLICEDNGFVAGADIKEFDKPPVPPFLHDIMSHIETAEKLWVAAIHGHALGGGLELALSCHYRIAAVSTKFGFPEVNLGLVPGAGGTVRAPRLISTANALTLIIGGKLIEAEMAKEWGLIDALAEADLQFDALVFTQKCVAQNKPAALTMRDPIKPLLDAEWDALELKTKARARGNHTPMEALAAVKDSVSLPVDQALQAEHDRFSRLTRSDQSKALRYIFFAERSVAKLSKIKAVQPRTIKSVAVMGGGFMGSGIATNTLLAGLPTTMIEKNDAALASGIASVKTNLDGSLSRGLISQAKHDAIIAQFSAGTDYSACQDADIVIEAVFEDMAVKAKVFAQLDTVTRPDAILATNTSYLDVGKIAEVVSDPSRVLGLHFFSPAHIMKLLEIICPPKLADDVLATVFRLAKQLGKIPVPAGVCDGFIGNRMMSAYRRECEYMLEDGALPQDIDTAMVDFGFPMGLFTMQDMAGLDIAWAMRKRQAGTRPDSLRYVDIADKLCEMGRLGRKKKQGWYNYTNGPKGCPDTVVEQLITSESRRKGIVRQTFTHKEIMARILSTMQLEGQHILDEGIAESAHAIDVVMVNGYGFPRWLGGPMFMKNLTANS